MVTDRYVVPDSHDEDGCPLVVTAVAPRKRDWWKVIRGKYKPQVFVTRPVNLKKSDRVLRENYAEPLEKNLHQRKPVLEMLRDK